MENAKKEVLRYLGHRNQKLSPELEVQIDACIELMQKSAAPRGFHREFEIERSADGLRLKNTDIILGGRDIAKHLEGCTAAVLLAATLGTEPDRLIGEWQGVDITRALILDSCGTMLIERFCDELENELAQAAGKKGLMSTTRFSPGYGDFPLELQPKLLDVLDAGRRIGLTCTDSLILLPRKSVTAVIGLGEKLCVESPDSCGGCGLNKTCGFRKETEHA